MSVFSTELLFAAIVAVFAFVSLVLLFRIYSERRVAKYDDEKHRAALEMLRQSFEKGIYDLTHRLTSTEARWRDVNHLVASRISTQPDQVGVIAELPKTKFLESYGLVAEEVRLDPKSVFVLTPFNPEYQEAFDSIAEACREIGLKSFRGDEEQVRGDLMPHILRQIAKARIVVANIDGRNPNVFYELGIAHAIDKVTILVTSSIEEAPFDLRAKKLVVYEDMIDLKTKLKTELARSLVDIVRDPGESSNEGKDTTIPPDDTYTSSVDGNVEAWHTIVEKRFQELREKRLSKKEVDPYGQGYWTAKFALQGNIRELQLVEFLEVLRSSVTGLTGWNIGWVPTRSGITPYPFERGIEVWLAEKGGKDPGHSDFWRAETVGRFALFRGYQEDGQDFEAQYSHIGLDYSLVTWRVAEVLLYLEKFAKHLAINQIGANLSFSWNNLEGRRLGYHKLVSPADQEYVCRQSKVESSIRIPDTALIRENLYSSVHQVVNPLFEAFSFFHLSEDQVSELLSELVDDDRKPIIRF